MGHSDFGGFQEHRQHQQKEQCEKPQDDGRVIEARHESSEAREAVEGGRLRHAFRFEG